jgi:hypothetical protein
MTDTYRALCAELCHVWSRATNPDDLYENLPPLIARARAALAEPEPPATGEVDTRYEFSVLDADCVEQAGGSAPSLTQALDEGRHYLASYEQDGPHTLELRRVEVLTSNHIPDATKMVEHADGEVAELVAWLRNHASAKGRIQREQFLRAADLLERLVPQPEPVPEGPSDEDLEAIVLKLWDKYGTRGWGGEEFMYDNNFSFALEEYRAVLARWGR